ncbi:MAG: hypothetical protein GOU98_04220 [Candidatus Altiarchaeota archaeon]|nr:hypothetical protein [Candidatus Altiarchaeota archaeon]
MTSFADSTLLKQQLFWDTDAAYEYSQRLIDHPEIYELPNLKGISNYTLVRNLVSDLRVKQSEAVIYGNSVQLKSFEIKHFIPKLINVILGFFEKGYKKDINTLVDIDYEIRDLHKKIMQTNTQNLFLSIANAQNLEAFSGRIFVEGVSFNTLSIKSQKMVPVADFSPFLMFNANEPSCAVNLFGGSKRLPLYIKNQYFSSVTALCKFEGFYAKNDLREFGRLWSTDFQLVMTRIDFLNDFAKFLGEAEGEVNIKQFELNKQFEESKYFLEEVKTIQTLLKNSSVKFALLEISFESKLLANSFEFDFLGWDHSKKLKNYFESIETSKSLGNTYLTLLELSSYLHNIDFETSLALSNIESKIETMENLCISYGSSCSFGGDISTRLLLTSNVFLDVRVNHLKSVGRSDESNELLVNLIESELTQTKNLIGQIEKYIEPKNVVVYTDAVLGFEIELNSLKDLSELTSLKTKIKEFRKKITNAFFEKNIKDARTTKAELISLSNIIDFEILNLPLSLLDNPIKNIIYYVSKHDFLAEMKEKYQEILIDFSSNIPSSVVCIPKIPILGETFEVKCKIFVNNTYKVMLESASSVIKLSHKPISISSKNFIGDTIKLKSVSFSGGQVRLNLVNINGVAFFETTYFSKAQNLNINCDYTYLGMNANYTCVIIPTCEKYGTVKLKHPFSGRQMNATHNYTYDGEFVYFQTKCNQPNKVVFSGPSVELSENNGLVIESLINSTQTNNLIIEVEHPRGYNASLSFNLNPYEKKVFEFDALITTTLNDTYNNKTSELTSPFVLLTSPPAFEFGCIEDNVLEAVRKKYKFDTPTCFIVDELKKSNTLFLSSQIDAASKEYYDFVPNPKLEVYLVTSNTYLERSTYLLKQLESLNDISSTLLKKYIQKAKLSHDAGDYLVSALYSQYALMKSTTNLKLDFRVLLALVVLLYGIYASKKKEKEELI